MIKMNWFISCVLIFFGFSLGAQDRPFKQAMFRDLTVTNTITQSLGDTTFRFHVDAVSGDDTRPDFRKRYYWFYQGVVRSTRGTFTGKVLHGTYEKFSHEGSLVEKGNFYKGLKDGTWLLFFPNGNVSRRVYWNEGQPSGEFTEFYQSGGLAKKGSFKQGKLDGKLLYYGNDGSVVLEERYRNGSIVKKKERTPKVKKNKKKDELQPGITLPNVNSPAQSNVGEPSKARLKKKSKEQVEAAPDGRIEPPSRPGKQQRKKKRKDTSKGPSVPEYK